MGSIRWDITWMAITAIATAVIAYYAIKSHCLTEEIKNANNLYQQQVNDLYQAIVVATFITTPNILGQFGEYIAIFKQHYKGKTPIFK